MRVPVSFQGWEHLTFLHWHDDTAAVQRLVPEELTVQDWEGRTWVGITPFRMAQVRPPGLPPPPGWGAFPELDVRAYVRTREGRDGIWFLGMVVPRVHAISRGAAVGPSVSHWLRRRRASHRQGMRFVEVGSIRMLWASGTNPAVSLSELHRIRSIIPQERLFLVFQDNFRSEAAQLADLVLPATTWGAETGTFTGVDRTVHLSEKPFELHGEARGPRDSPGRRPPPGSAGPGRRAAGGRWTRCTAASVVDPPRRGGLSGLIRQASRHTRNGNRGA